MLRLTGSYQIFDGSSDEWNDLVSKGPDASLLQTWEYGESKAKTGPWNIERGLLLGEGQSIRGVQTLVRHTPVWNAGLAWINRGPVGFDETNETNLDFLVERFCNQLGLYLRIAPAISIANPTSALAHQANFRTTGTLGWASSVIDLTRSKNELRKSLHGKWRTALSKAEKANLEIDYGTSQSLFDTFMAGHFQHLSQRGPDGGLDPALLYSLQGLLPPDRKMISILVRKDRAYLGGAVIARYGETGEYLAGHNTYAGRSENAGQMTLWTALMVLQELGLKRFDLGGMDEWRSPPGIFKFKQRMGGLAYRLPNEIDACTRGVFNRFIRWQVSRASKVGLHHRNAAKL